MGDIVKGSLGYKHSEKAWFTLVNVYVDLVVFTGIAGTS